MLRIFRLFRQIVAMLARLQPVTLVRQQLGRWWRLLAAELFGEPARRRRRAQHLAASLYAELHRLGFSRRVARKKRVRMQRVQFEEPLLLTRDELWLPIDLQRLPTGVKSNELREEDVLKSIEDRLNVTVRIDTLANGKMAFVVRVSGKAFPEVFGINTFKIPVDAPPLAFPLGIDGETAHRWADLAKLPHLLMVGPTGKGKSTLVHAMLSTWIARNTANDIEIWLADHKGGVELNRYRELMGTRGRPGIVRRFSYQPIETIALLQAALKELEKRNETLRQADCSDLDDYARNTGQFIRRIAIVIDEIFFLMLNKEKADSDAKNGMTVSQWAEHLFAKIASAGRAAGVHLVIATQRTGKDVLTPLITANFESRIVFGLADMYQSIYVLGNSDAVGMPKGRIIFREEGGLATEIQSPLVKPDQTRLLIARVARYGPDGGLGRSDESRQFREDAKLLLTVACEEFENKFAAAALFQHPRVRGVVRRDRVEEIARRLVKDGVLISYGTGKARRVSDPFVGRPHLLDSLYAPPEEAPEAPQNAAGSPPGAAVVAESSGAVATAPEGHQDAVKPAPEETNGLPAPDATGQIAPDPDQTPPPGPFRNLFEELGGDSDGQQ